MKKIFLNYTGISADLQVKRPPCLYPGNQPSTCCFHKLYALAWNYYQLIKLLWITFGL